MRPDPQVATLEAILDAWAAIPIDDAPVNAASVILPCAAIAAYGEVGARRQDWWPDEMAKLHRAASDRGGGSAVPGARVHDQRDGGGDGRPRPARRARGSDDADLRWIAHQNLGKARLRRLGTFDP